MAASILTLAEIIRATPLAITQRYGNELFVRLANEVLARIEKGSDCDYMRDEVPLLLQNGVNEYAIPAGIRSILGIYPTCPGTVFPDKRIPYAFREKAGRLRFNFTPTFDATIEDITGALTEASDRELIDATAGKLDTPLDNALVGRMAKVIHDETDGSGNVEFRFVISNSPDDTKAGLDGDLAESAAIGAHYLVTGNFLMVHGSRSLKRFTFDPAAEEGYELTEAIPLSQDMEELFRLGFGFKLHFQVDQTSQQCAQWEQRFLQELANFDSSAMAIGGDARPMQGRGMPDFGF